MAATRSGRTAGRLSHRRIRGGDGAGDQCWAFQMGLGRYVPRSRSGDGSDPGRFDRFRPVLHHDGRRTHSQFQHHRPHRPREDHPVGPVAPVHRHRRRPDAAGPAPRCHGPRKGTRYHHQGPSGHDVLQGQEWGALRAEPDRHPGTRRFRLRGEPLAERLRGSAAHRRCRPRRRGPDGRQRASGHEAGPDDHPGDQQDRPAARQHPHGQAAVGRDPGHPRR